MIEELLELQTAKRTLRVVCVRQAVHVEAVAAQEVYCVYPSAEAYMKDIKKIPAGRSTGAVQVAHFVI